MKRSAALVVAGWMLWMTTLHASIGCTISTTPVTFGTYDVFRQSPTMAVGSVRYECAVPVGLVWITMSRGGGISFAQRSMQKGSERLHYNLFRDPRGDSIWGDGTGGSQGYLHLHIGTTATLPVYGEMPAGQDVTAGTYTDAVTVTINF
jgi:spore coat protein U-like protein